MPDGTRRPVDTIPLHIAPISRDDARRFVGAHHRHNQPPKFVVFAVGLRDDVGDLRGVAIVARPKARALADAPTGRG